MFGRPKNDNFQFEPITDPEEIESKFDAIKDHKPKAAKKLAVIGDLLASEYLLEPERANEMWLYLTDLNLDGDSKTAKFYVTQVFMKLVERLRARDAASLIAMDPGRIETLAENCYTGWTLWDCERALFGGLFEAGLCAQAVSAIESFLDNFTSLETDNPNAFHTAMVTAEVCRAAGSEAAALVLQRVRQYSVEISDFVDAVYASAEGDARASLFVALKCKEAATFYDLLWTTRHELDPEEARGLWVEYLEQCDETDSLPYGSIFNDTDDDSGESKELFYVGLEKDEDRILERYFDRPKLYNLEKSVLIEWIFDEDWSRFTRYTTMLLAAGQDHAPDQQLIYTLNKFMDACFYDEGRDTTDDFGRSYRDAMCTRSHDFARSLAQICAGITGSSCYEEFQQIVAQFIQRLDGNLDLLHDVGIMQREETRTPEERLIAYAEHFLNSGKPICPPRETAYQLILDAFLAEGFYPAGAGIGDRHLDDFYRWAYNEALVEFFFTRFPSESGIRANMISACIRKGDVDRASELTDMMPVNEKTGRFKNDRTDEWAFNTAWTMASVADRYDYSKKDDYFLRDVVTDDMRATAAQLIEGVLNRAPKSQKGLLASELTKVSRCTGVEDGYVEGVLSALDEYTTFPYEPQTRKKINELSMTITSSFERLFKLGRIDVIGKTISSLAGVRDQLTGVQLTTFMYLMASKIDGESLLEIYRTYPDAFESWAHAEGLQDRDILVIATKLAATGDRAAFDSFKSLVLAAYGWVDGLDSCLHSEAVDRKYQA